MSEATQVHTEHALKDRELFDRIADKYCRKDLKPASRVARRYRLIRTIKALPEGRCGSLLEVGCGAGFTVPYLAGRFDRFVGVDYSEKLIELAQKQNSGPNVEFIAADIGQYDPPVLFDAVVMIGVIHHFDDMPGLMRHIVRLVKPGGWVAANEPQPGNPLIGLLRRMRKRVDEAYSDDQAELSVATLRKLYEDAGLTSVRVQPQGFVSTPFAEVVMPMQRVAKAAAHLACGVDTVLETVLGPVGRWLSWNLVAVGRKPPSTNARD